MAGPITTLTGTVTTAIAWSASRIDAVYGIVANSIGRSKVVAFGAAATNVANQIKVIRQVLTASQTVTLDLSAASDNVVQDGTATFAKVWAAMLQLLSTTDVAGVGTAATSVTVGAAAATQQLLFFEDVTSAARLTNGATIAWQCAPADAITMDSSHKSFKLVNNDSGVSAAVEITLVGTHS